MSMKKIFILLLLFFSGILYANDVIYTWGYASLINDILQAVRGAITGVDDLVKSAMAIAFFIFALKKAMDSRANPVMEFGKLILLFSMVSYFFLKAPNDDNHRFIIEDRITGEMHTVSQIPIGIGKTFSLVTKLEDGIAELMETFFSTPASINYRNSGLGFSISTHNNVSNMKIMDSYYARTYNEYISECVFYDISTGVRDISTIMDNDALSSSIFNSTSSRLTNKYTSSTPSGEVAQCSEVATYLSSTIGTYMTQVEKVAAAMNGQTLSNFQANAGAVQELFFNSANNTRDYLQQMVLINMTSDAIINTAKVSGLDPSALAWSSAVADQNLRTSMTSKGVVAQSYLPKVKAYFIAMIIAISWLIVILSIMFGDYKHIMLFFTLMLWMVFWTPLLLIINYFTDLNIREILLAMKDATGAGFTISHNQAILNELNKWQDVVNWLVMLTPLLAYSLVKASEQGFVSLTRSFSSDFGGAGQKGADKVLSDAAQKNPTIRVGNDVYGDIGGQITSQSQSTSNGHSWNDNKFTDKASGTNTYNGTMTDGSGSFGMVGGQVVNAQSQVALSAAHKNTDTASSELSNAISSSSTSVIGNDKSITQAQGQGLSTQDAHNITEAKGTAISKAFEHMQGYGEEFQNIKKLAMSGGGSVSANFLDKKLGASGGVEYSGVDADGKKYSWTDNSKNSEQNFNQIQEQFSKVVAGNSSFQASYAEMLKVTDSQSYSEVQNAMKKLSKAETTETGLNANNLPAFLNNWIGNDERLSRMPKEEAAKYAMGEISNLVAKGDTNKLSDLVSRYGANGFNIENNNNLIEPTKSNKPDIKSQYDAVATSIQNQTNDAMEKSKDEGKEKVANFNKEHNNGTIENQVGNSVVKGKEWADKGLFSRFWDDNGSEVIKGAAGIGAALGLSSVAAKKIGGQILDKFKGANSVDDLENAMKKTEQLDKAIQKNSPEVKKLMDEFGMTETFERNGGVFNKNGSIDLTKTQINKNLSDYVKSSTIQDLPKTPEKVAREQFSNTISETIANTNDPKKIDELNKLKSDVINGNNVSNQRMSSLGFNGGKDLNENFDFKKAGEKIIASNPELKAQTMQHNERIDHKGNVERRGAINYENANALLNNTIDEAYKVAKPVTKVAGAVLEKVPLVGAGVMVYDATDAAAKGDVKGVANAIDPTIVISATMGKLDEIAANGAQPKSNTIVQQSPTGNAVIPTTGGSNPTNSDVNQFSKGLSSNGYAKDSDLKDLKYELIKMQKNNPSSSIPSKGKDNEVL